MSVLRKLFGPSREEIWRRLTAEIKGRYVKGDFFGRDRVEAAHGQWTVTLDTYAVAAGKTVIMYTRLRAPYVNPTGFRFTVYRKSLFSGIGKALGMQDIEVGYSPFDEDFIVQGTDEAQVRRLFANARTRELVAAQPEILLTVKDDEGWFGPKFPEGVDELCFTVTGVIKDVERLKLLYDLFAETLDQLCRIGAAYERAPDVTV